MTTSKGKKAGKKNLVPIATRTTEEQRKIAKMGGWASGVSRRHKRILSERIKLALENSTNSNLNGLKRQIRELWPNRHTKNGKEEMRVLVAQAKTIKECGIELYKILLIIENPMSEPEMVLKAVNALWDREGGKPTQTVHSLVTRTENVVLDKIDPDVLVDSCLKLFEALEVVKLEGLLVSLGNLIQVKRSNEAVVLNG